jgi:hypothetical protein
MYHNGIDRINSNFGYIKNNIIPCCINCNYGKSDLSFDDFMIWIDRIKNKYSYLRDLEPALV